jgi:RNA polymerase nonessential primary-like sigma factor
MVDGECLKGDQRTLLEQMPKLQRSVLKMHYGIDVEEPMSLTGIGCILGMSRDRNRNWSAMALPGCAASVKRSRITSPAECQRPRRWLEVAGRSFR